MKRYWMLGGCLLLTVLAIGAIACKSSKKNTSATQTAEYQTPKATQTTETPQATTGTPQATTEATPGASTTLIVTQNATKGAIVTDASGKTLYKYSKDGSNVSNCTGACAQVWPPLTVPSGTTPTAGTNVTGQLGTIQRTDGTTTQVTLDGSPLYYYANDTAAGDATGDGLNSFSVIKAGG